MSQHKQSIKLKMARMEVTILPIHKEKILEEIRVQESKGRIITKSDIIREELEGRYFKTDKPEPNEQ